MRMNSEVSLDAVHALLRSSRLGEAEQILSQLFALTPDAPELHHAHAVLLQMSGRPQDALLAMQRAVGAAPQVASLRLALGQVAASAGQIDAAVAAFRDAIMMQPEFIEAWYLLGMTLYGAQRDAEALPALQRANALAPEHPQVLRALAETEYALEHHAEALRLYKIIGASGTSYDAGLALRLSQCERRTGAAECALLHVQSGLKRFPDDALLWQELGWVQEDLGHAAQAQIAYDRAHALQPGWADPLGAAIALARGAAPPALLSKAEALLASDRLPKQQQAFLHHVLGKHADSRGEYSSAAEHWQLANRLRRSLDGVFERDKFAAQIDAAIATFTPEFFASLRGVALHDVRPVFVLGMPRSGTTLVEQIISAHPQAHGCGELTGIVAIADSIPMHSGLRWPQDAACIDSAWLLERAQYYLDIAARGASAEVLRLVDKQPYNFLHIGLMAMLFADARVVWCRRDARDIALSVYSESFAPSATYATDLDDIAFVIAQQERLMRHWQVVSPLPIIEMQYENLVSETEAQIRRLIDFTGLSWDSRCLDFHNSGRSVQTISRWQVRQPIHTRSIGRWKNYPQWFGKN